MKKKMMMLALALCCVLLLSACGCKHETWTDADCTTPKTCAECGETEGAPLGHSWLAATCTEPKTCEICGEISGEPLGHTYDDSAYDCEEPKLCGHCSLPEREAIPHKWVEATTEEPKTCSECGKTEGERIITDERFQTAACRDLFGKWAGKVEVPTESFDPALNPYGDTISIMMYMEYRNDGTMTMSMGLHEDSNFMDMMQHYTEDALYTEFEGMGYNRAEADAAFQEAYGMSISEYVRIELEKIDVDEMFADFSEDGVYYVKDGLLYIGEDWDEEMSQGDEFTLQDGVLSIPTEDGVLVDFVPVEE